METEGAHAPSLSLCIPLLYLVSSKWIHWFVLASSSRHTLRILCIRLLPDISSEPTLLGLRTKRIDCFMMKVMLLLISWNSMMVMKVRLYRVNRRLKFRQYKFHIEHTDLHGEFSSSCVENINRLKEQLREAFKPTRTDPRCRFMSGSMNYKYYRFLC